MAASQSPTNPFEPPNNDYEDLAYVSKVIQQFMTRAFRRPVGDDEVARMVDFIDR